MGMDVIGLNPTTAEGKIFVRNIWGWHPLATLSCWIAPEVCSTIAPNKSEPLRAWHYNDGHGLDDVHSLELADALERALADGRVDSYVDMLKKTYPNCHLRRKDVWEFVAFLRGCQGFRIC